MSTHTVHLASYPVYAAPVINQLQTLMQSWTPEQRLEALSDLTAPVCVDCGKWLRRFKVCHCWNDE